MKEHKGTHVYSRILIVVVLTICVVAGIVLGQVHDWQSSVVPLEEGQVWTSAEPEIYLEKRSRYESAHGYIVIDGEKVELFYGTRSGSVVLLEIIPPGETKPQLFLRATGWMSVGNEKLTIYDLDYFGDIKLDCDKIVLHKQK